MSTQEPRKKANPYKTEPKVIKPQNAKVGISNGLAAATDEQWAHY